MQKIGTDMQKCEEMMAGKEDNRNADGLELRSLQSASLGSDTVPSRVRLAPWGAVESTSGTFVVDEEAVELATAAFEEHGTDLPIDYEHQTLGGSYSSPSGKAPAAGWIKRLVGESGVGLLADIEWTPQATEMLVSKQYRYLSPVAIVRREDRKLTAIHSAALTNKPAIVGMQPIVNARSGQAGDARQEPLAVLRAELHLSPKAPPEEVLLAASRRLVELQRVDEQRRVEARVREAIEAGKLVEAQRTWAEELVAREEDLFEKWLQTAPVVVSYGAIAAPQVQDLHERRHRATEARAKSEFRFNRLLSGLTSEEAYLKEALREVTLGVN